MKKIIITGASRGIGFALAKHLCLKGHEIVAVARSRRGLSALQNACSHAEGKLHTLVFDLSADNYQETLFPFVKKSIGTVDILVNNAGLLIVKKFVDFRDIDFDRIFAVNVKSVFKTIQILLPLMHRESHVVNISSMGGFQGSEKFPGLSLYSAAKGAVSVLTESLATELTSYGISVNALALGAVQTEMLSEAFPEYKAPLTADEMAGFIADFALNGNRFFNGKVLPVSSSTP